MLRSHFYERARKEALSSQPFIDDCRQRVLVAGRACSALELLRGHVGYGASNSLEAIAGTLGNYRQAKITEQDGILIAEQHVFRFHIPMDEFLIVGILQSGGNLPDIRYDSWRRQNRT